METTVIKFRGTTQLNFDQNDLGQSRKQNQQNANKYACYQGLPLCQHPHWLSYLPPTISLLDPLLAAFRPVSPSRLLEFNSI